MNKDRLNTIMKRSIGDTWYVADDRSYSDYGGLIKFNSLDSVTGNVAVINIDLILTRKPKENKWGHSDNYLSRRRNGSIRWIVEHGETKCELKGMLRFFGIEFFTIKKINLKKN